VKISCKLIIIWVNYDRKKKGSLFMKHRVYLRGLFVLRQSPTQVVVVVLACPPSCSGQALRNSATFFQRSTGVRSDRAFKQVGDTVRCRITIWAGVRNCWVQSMFVGIKPSTVARSRLWFPTRQFLELWCSELCCAYSLQPSVPSIRRTLRQL